MIIQIIIFSVKLDKFTVFFDKFLKIYFFANDCNIKGFPQHPGAGHSDPAQKKFFGSPAFPRSSPHSPPAQGP